MMVMRLSPVSETDAGNTPTASDTRGWENTMKDLSKTRLFPERRATDAPACNLDSLDSTRETITMNKPSRTRLFSVTLLSGAMTLGCVALRASEDDYDGKSWLQIMEENKPPEDDGDDHHPSGGWGSSSGRMPGSGIGPGIGSSSSSSGSSSRSGSGNSRRHSANYYQQRFNADKKQIEQIEAKQQEITEHYERMAEAAALKDKYRELRHRAHAIGKKCWSRHIDSVRQKSFVRRGLERSKAMFHEIHRVWAAAPAERAAHDFGTRAWHDWVREMERGMADYERSLNAAWSTWEREMRRRADSANDRMVRDAFHEQIALARRAFEGELADERAEFQDGMKKASHEWGQLMSAARAKRHQHTQARTKRMQALRNQACHIGHVLWTRHLGPARQAFFANARLGQGKAKLVADAINREWAQAPDEHAAEEFGRRAWDNWAREVQAGLGRWEQAMHAAWNAWDREMRAKAASTGDPVARQAIHEQITVARRNFERELGEGKATFQKDMASAHSNWQQQMAQARNARRAHMLAASHGHSDPGNIPRTHHEFETAGDVTPNPFEPWNREKDATDRTIEIAQEVSKVVPILRIPAKGTGKFKEGIEAARADALNETRRLDPEARPVPRHSAGGMVRQAVDTVERSGGTAWLGLDGFWYYVVRPFYTPRSPHTMILDRHEVAPGMYRVGQRRR